MERFPSPGREFRIDQAVVDATALGGHLLGAERVSRAWSNHLYRVRTTEGEFAVKHLLNPWDDALWREWLAEAVVLEQAAIAAGVHAPPIVLNAHGEVLTDVDGATVRVHRWVDGAHPCPEAPVTVEVARSVGADLARTHATGVRPSRDDVFPQADGATAATWSSLVDDLAGIDQQWAERADAVGADVAQVVDWFDEWRAKDEPTVMSHGDVDPKNLVLDADDRVWWVDWDVAAPWRPLDELARTALSMSGLDRPDLAREVVAAHREVSGVDAVLDHLNLTLDLVIGLDWTARCLRRTTGLEACDDQRRAESIEMAASELDELPARVALARDFPHWLAG